MLFKGMQSPELSFSRNLYVGQACVRGLRVAQAFQLPGSPTHNSGSANRESSGAGSVHPGEWKVKVVMLQVRG